ncbi:uncharacterized protein L201_004364 [Kwoniella dendrophila CBS 6074]|uniref:F-box domain-containing protein n=1 Tax=Kwoniella dendrophila CBS 6074 TaxID=1295534 RepID=A0AAX4JVH6_9TREE
MEEDTVNPLANLSRCMPKSCSSTDQRQSYISDIKYRSFINSAKLPVVSSRQCKLFPNVNPSKGTFHQRNQQLPNEIIDSIASYSGPSTLSTLMRVSFRTCHIAAKYLYREITITRKNVEKVFIGLPRSAHYHRFCARQRNKVFAGLNAAPEDLAIQLVWPEVPMDSEEEKEDTDSRDRMAVNERPYITTSKSRTRKINLFKYTIVLHIACRFPTQLCQDLIAQFSKEDPSRVRIFPKAKKVIIHSQTVKDWANRQDLGLTDDTRWSTYRRENQDRPFFRLLGILAKPANCCVTLPLYTSMDRLKYFRIRTKYDNIPAYSNARTTRNIGLTNRFKHMITKIAPEFINQIAYLLNPTESETTITIHNFTHGSLPYEYVPNKVFFWSFAIGVEQSTHHYNHVTSDTRKSQLENLAVDTMMTMSLHPEGEGEKRRNIEIVCEDGELDRINWKRIVRKAIKKHNSIFVDRLDGSDDLINAIKLVKKSATTECNCCGTIEGNA